MNKQIIYDYPVGGWISLAEVAAVVGTDHSSLHQRALNYITPHVRVFPDSNGQVSLAFTFAEARELLDAHRAIGHQIPRQTWELA